MSSAISVRSLSKDFGSLKVLSDISFDVERGEFISIIGPSGCGKSTLLKIIGGILKPTTGSINLNETGRAEKREFGFVFQNPVLLPWRDLSANVNLPLELFEQEDNQRVSDLIKLFGLEGFEHSLPSELSGGMQQRAALARALVFNPSVLMMDEPFASLDELTRTKLKYEVMDVCQKLKTTAIMVTHSIVDAVLMSDRVVLLSSRPGRVLQIHNIDLPRPRRSEMETTPEVIKQVEAIRQSL